MSRHLRRSRLAFGLLLLAAAIPTTVLAARAWQIAASPSTVYLSTQTSIQLTVTDTGNSGGGDEITCVQVTVPSSFTITSVSIVSVHGQTSGAAYGAWVDVWPGGSTVTFKDPSDDYPLVGSSPPEDRAIFRISGKANSLLMAPWTAKAFDHSDKKADTTACASGAFPTKSLSFLVLPLPGPTPTATPTPTPTPTPAPTPTPTPAPTPTRTPPPTPTPTPRPTSPPATPAVTPSPTDAPATRKPPATPAPAIATPDAPDASAAPTESPGASEPMETPSGSAPSIAPPDGTAAPGTTVQPGATLAPPAALVLEGGSGDAGVQLDGLSDAVLAAFARLPGGMLAFIYPAAGLVVPGMLLIIAILAQAFGALAWIPIVRRKLGGVR